MPRKGTATRALDLAEALSLMRNPPADGEELYEVMQMDIGTLVEGGWEDEPRSPLLTDPSRLARGQPTLGTAPGPGRGRR